MTLCCPFEIQYFKRCCQNILKHVIKTFPYHPQLSIIGLKTDNTICKFQVLESCFGTPEASPKKHRGAPTAPIYDQEVCERHETGD